MVTYYSWADGEGSPVIRNFGHCFKVPHRQSKPDFAVFWARIVERFRHINFSQVMILFFQRGCLLTSVIDGDP
jgi:hypothetical protein